MENNTENEHKLNRATGVVWLFIGKKRQFILKAMHINWFWIILLKHKRWQF